MCEIMRKGIERDIRNAVWIEFEIKFWNCNLDLLSELRNNSKLSETHFGNFKWESFSQLRIFRRRINNFHY